MCLPFSRLGGESLLNSDGCDAWTIDLFRRPVAMCYCRLLCALELRENDSNSLHLSSVQHYVATGRNDVLLATTV